MSQLRSNWDGMGDPLDDPDYQRFLAARHFSDCARAEPTFECALCKRVFGECMECDGNKGQTMPRWCAPCDRAEYEASREDFFEEVSGVYRG